jgi:cysteine synthase A
VISGQPKGPHKIQGLGAGFIPKNLETDLIDEVVTVSSETSFEVSRMIAKVEGIPGGISTGANVAASMSVAERPEYAGKTIVTFAPSSAERYMSSELFVDPQPRS